MTKKLNATPDQIVEAICSVAFAKGASSSLRENIIEALSTLPTIDERGVRPLPPEVVAQIKKHSCRNCSGFGYTSEHNRDDPHHDGECSGSCPVAVPCEDCHGEGSYVTLDALRDYVANQPSTDALVERIVEAVMKLGTPLFTSVEDHHYNIRTAIRTALQEGGEG